MSREKPATRDDYRQFVTLTTRWADNDVYGHINNVAYYGFIDTAVNQLLIERGLLDVNASAQIGVVVESGCRYHASAHYPDVIHAGVRVGHWATAACAMKWDCSKMTRARPWPKASSSMSWSVATTDGHKPWPRL